MCAKGCLADACAVVCTATGAIAERRRPIAAAAEQQKKDDDKPTTVIVSEHGRSLLKFGFIPSYVFCAKRVPVL